jgi:hypothetical protein
MSGSEDAGTPNMREQSGNTLVGRDKAVLGHEDDVLARVR